MKMNENKKCRKSPRLANQKQQKPKLNDQTQCTTNTTEAVLAGTSSQMIRQSPRLNSTKHTKTKINRKNLKSLTTINKNWRKKRSSFPVTNRYRKKTKKTTKTAATKSPSASSLSTASNPLSFQQSWPSSSTSPETNPLNLSTQTTVSFDELKFQLKKATIKFDKACKQLITLDQHMNDMQNSYSNSLENDRKTFKILYRMQLATLEGTHNAYLEYIDRQVEKIKKIKRLLFSDTNVNGLMVANTEPLLL